MNVIRPNQRFFALSRVISGINPLRLVLGAFVLALLTSLAFSERPNTKRIAEINHALASTNINETLFSGFKEQVKWVARHAGVNEPIFFDQSINPDRLDVVVSHSRFSDLTKCGLANAIYDPNLNAIFIDEYLLRPRDLPFLGVDGPSSMYSEADFGFWQSGLSFIIAHELGHYKAGDRAAAFVSSDWLTSEPKSVNAELEADAFAVTTLARAYGDPKMPSSLIENNALHLFGLDHSELKGAELAAGDMIGSFKGMTLFMQFMSGPYSPFFVDSTHPSFLGRIMLATGELPISPDSLVSGQSPILLEEVKRLRFAARSDFVEILAPGPLARVAATKDSVFFGIRDLIHTSIDEGLASLYKASLLLDSNSPNFELLERETSSETIDDAPDAWLDLRIEEYAPSTETLGLAAGVGVVAEIRLHQPYTEYTPNGLQYSGEGWILKTPNQRWVISKMQVKEKAASFFENQNLEIGSPLVNDNALIFPVNLKSDNRFVSVVVKPIATIPPKTSFTVLRPGNSFELLEPEISFALVGEPFNADTTLETGWIDIEGARWTGDAWLFPSRDDGARSPHVWRLLQVKGSGPPSMWAEERLLSDFIQEHGEASYGRDLDPHKVSLMVLNPSAVLIWYNTDSVWLVKPDEVKPIFHPAPTFLKVTKVDENHVLFWISNATKAYLVKINTIRK
jgi:hypothetical protein